jgi:hypothetical protein
MIDQEIIVKIENNRLKYLGYRRGGENLFRLATGPFVKVQLYVSVLEKVYPFLERMKSGEYYTVRQMCGEDFWLSLERWCPNMAGMCVVDAVKRGWLPLIFKPQKPSDRSTRKYRAFSKDHSSTDKEA